MILKTERLVLRPFEDRDKEKAIDIFLDDEVKKTYMLPDFASREEAEKLFRRLKEYSISDNHRIFAVCMNETLIGFINDVEIKNETIEIGYVIAREYWNQGYASEAVKAVIRHLLKSGFTCVRAGAFSENPASVRVMQKCGMKKIDFEEEIEYRGKNHRCVYYEI